MSIMGRPRGEPSIFCFVSLPSIGKIGNEDILINKCIKNTQN